MYVQSRVIEHLFEEWSKFKKKKKEKKMTSNERTSKFEYDTFSKGISSGSMGSNTISIQH